MGKEEVAVEGKVAVEEKVAEKGKVAVEEVLLLVVVAMLAGNKFCRLP